MNKIANVLKVIVNDIESGKYVPTADLFDWDAVGIKQPKVNEVDETDALNDYFNETVGKSGRTLRHSLNKVKKSWEMKDIRVPRGSRALVEVAVDCKLDPKDLCEKILQNPEFEGRAIGNAARELLNIM